MQRWLRNPKAVWAVKWHGGENEVLVSHLRSLGKVVAFQTSEQPTEEVYLNPSDTVPAEVPSEGLMVIVGQYNWEITYVEVGEYVRFSLTDSDASPMRVDTFDELRHKVLAGQAHLRVSTSKAGYFEEGYTLA